MQTALALASAFALAAGTTPGVHGPGDQGSEVHVAQPLETIGLNVHTVDARSLALLETLNVDRVRFTLYWHLWTVDAAYRRNWNRSVRALTDRGIDVLVVLHQPPVNNFRLRDREHRELARFMAARVAEHPQVTYWQLYNEVNVGFHDVVLFGHPHLPQRAQGVEYARMLQIVVPAIRRANPRARVVLNPVAGDGREWLRGVLSVTRDFDVVARHTYGFPLEAHFVEMGREIREIIGDRWPLWVTEFGTHEAVIAPGWPRTPADIDRYHLDAWRGSVTANDTARVWDRLYGYVLMEEGSSTGHDLVREDGTLRPAAEWLRTRNARAAGRVR